jgi:hypothetical protein
VIAVCGFLVLDYRMPRESNPDFLNRSSAMPTLSKTRSDPLNATRALAMASTSLITNLAVRMEKRPSQFDHYHAVGADKPPTGDYEWFEKIVFEKERGR